MTHSRPCRRRLTVLLVVLALPWLTGFSELGEPENLSVHKQQIRDYYESGAHEAQVAEVVEGAIAYLEKMAGAEGRLAIVLDIDDTALSTWPNQLANDFGFVWHGGCSLPQGPCSLRGWVENAEAPVITPTLELYRVARQLGYDVFFITGRIAPWRAATEENLRRAGFTEWAGLILKPADEHYASAANFKTPVRKGIAEDGYRIVLNMGDQVSDLAGGYADRRFKLPNPVYRIR